MALDAPHFDFPFRRAGGGVAVNEQDTDEDIMSCVQALLSTEIGEREDLPEYGLPEQIFRQGGIDVHQVQAVVERWEPRAVAILSTNDIADLAQHAQVRIGRRIADG